MKKQNKPATNFLHPVTAITSSTPSQIELLTHSKLVCHNQVFNSKLRKNVGVFRMISVAANSKNNHLHSLHSLHPLRTLTADSYVCALDALFLLLVNNCVLTFYFFISFVLIFFDQRNSFRAENLIKGLLGSGAVSGPPWDKAEEFSVHCYSTVHIK